MSVLVDYHVNFVLCFPSRVADPDSRIAGGVTSDREETAYISRRGASRTRTPRRTEVCLCDLTSFLRERCTWRAGQRQTVGHSPYSLLHLSLAQNTSHTCSQHVPILNLSPLSHNSEVARGSTAVKETRKDRWFRPALGQRRPGVRAPRSAQGACTRRGATHWCRRCCPFRRPPRSSRAQRRNLQ